MPITLAVLLLIATMFFYFLSNRNENITLDMPFLCNPYHQI